MPVPEQADSLINDKVAHAVIFFGLSVLIDLAYRNYKFLFMLALVLLGYGLIVELLQGFSGYRAFSVFDLIADAVGIAFYAIVRQTKFVQKFYLS